MGGLYVVLGVIEGWISGCSWVYLELGIVGVAWCLYDLVWLAWMGACMTWCSQHDWVLFIFECTTSGCLQVPKWVVCILVFYSGWRTDLGGVPIWVLGKPAGVGDYLIWVCEVPCWVLQMMGITL